MAASGTLGDTKMNNQHWILGDDGKTLKPVGLHEWAEWYDKSCRTKVRVVAKEEIEGSRVSTVFLGLDHNFFEEGPPLLFETMVFDGPLDQEMDRYSTWEEAETGHDVMCKRVRSAHGATEPQQATISPSEGLDKEST